MRSRRTFALSRPGGQSSGRCPEKPSRELVGELAIRIVLLHEAQELLEVVTVQPLQVCLGKALTELPQVRSGPDLPDQLLSRRVVRLEAIRVVANEVYPGRAPITPGAYKGTIVLLRREPHLEERVRQS